LVTGYPGSPATAVFEAILDQTSAETVQLEWNSNEKVAIEIAFGASLAGQRALLCVKGVGLNIALDPLMTMNLSGCNAGFVILVGDDPGGWGSQNEQDSRALAMLTEIPWLEPTTVSDAYTAMREAFRLSEEMGLPVVVRITRALALADGDRPDPDTRNALRAPIPSPLFQPASGRWVVLPINVVAHHQRLLQRLDAVQAAFEKSTLNGLSGEGTRGVIAAGFAFQKLSDLLGERLSPDLQILRLGTLYPLPPNRLRNFLQTVESVLVLEETAPVVERGVRAAAQSERLTLPVYGRDTAHVPPAGELFAPEIAQALNRYTGGIPLHTESEHFRAMPSREPLCEGCPYVPTFDALLEVRERRGGADEFVIVGDPGCMVRSQMPPYELMDVKHGLGSAIGMAAGIAVSRDRIGKRVIALCGDSGFLHSGFNGLMDAARMGVRLLVIILDNGTTALSGGQPHPGSPVDTRGRPRRRVNLAALAHEAGAGAVRVVNLDAGEDIRAPIFEGVDFDGLAVVIAHGQCVRPEFHPSSQD
jgi:indolepyruvate ferredoxin oxidoreductase alpha subunit